MPVLYFIGFFFFGLSYLVNKTVIFKFYQKSLTVDRLLPCQVMHLFNTAIYLHLAFGCLMLTNHVLYLSRDGPTDEVFVMPRLPLNPKAETESLMGIMYEEQ